MSWRCPTCGFEANEDSARKCDAGCGYVKYPCCVAFVSPNTGKRLTVRIDTIIGKHLLRSVVGDDYVYASDAQFRVYKDLAMASWAIRHIPEAKNPTFYNGAETGRDARTLANGDMVSVGLAKAQLLVEIAD